MRIKLKTITKILIIVCFIGLSLLLYPTVSNYWNEKHATHAIISYVEEMDWFDEEQFKEVWNNAVVYNTDLTRRENVFVLPEEMISRYQENLNITGTGIMGYIEIPKLDVSLPIYHGTSNSILQRAIGHIDWTSLPVGGESTHCVVSGHRGLPSAKLFTDIDKLREGDTFELMILDTTLTYEVDQIRTVLPDEVDELQIVNGKDYCTLVTCTPYGINTHRLLVRGHRIESVVGEARVVSEAVIIDQLIVASIVAFPILFILVMAVMFKKPEKKSEHNKKSL
jgi:sortase A